MGLFWAAVALPIIALYILKIRRRRQMVPTLMFWDQIFQDTAPRSLWRRLRHWLSLLMQLAMVLLLTLALADLVYSSESNRPKHWILILDQSASMQATDGRPTRLDEIKEIAHGVIRSMRVRDQATLIAAGTQPTIVCGRTYHQPTLHKAVEGLRSIDAPSRLPEGLRLAESVEVADEEDRCIVLLTDGGGELQVGEGLSDSVLVYRSGGRSDNVAITAFAVRPRADNPLELQGMLRAANFSDTETDVEIQLTRDGDIVDAISMKLGAGEEDLRTFQLVHSAGHILQAELSHSDMLTVDNRAKAILPPIQKKQVVLVSKGNLFLECVLAAHPWMEVQRVSPNDYPSLEEKADILVFDEFVPDRLPIKPCLFVHPLTDSDLWSIGEELKNPLVSNISEGDESKLLHHVNIENVTFRRARSVKVNSISKGECKTLISSFENPLLVRWSAASPAVVLLSVDINQSDLPWRTAFPILAQNTLNYLAGQIAEPVSAYFTGQTASLHVRAKHADATDAYGKAVPVVIEDHRLMVGPVSTTGLVKVKADESTIDLAFNLTDKSESDIRQTPASESKNTNRLPLSASTWSWPWWVILVMVAIGFSTVEWCLHQRRQID
jgi:hypothetical protein